MSWNEKMKEVWNKHLPNLADKKKSQLVGGRSVRMRLGLFYTKKEFEKMKKKILRKKLK